MADVRVTQLYAEALTQNSSADVRLTSQHAEALTQNSSADVRLTSLSVEVLAPRHETNERLLQPIWTTNSENPGLLSSGTTFYFSALPQGGNTTVADGRLGIVDAYGIIRKLRVKLKTAPGSGITRTFTLRKNGADTTLKVSISGTETEASNAADEISVAPGDYLVFKMAPSGGTPAATNFVVLYEFIHVDAYSSVYAIGGDGSLSGTSTVYAAMFSGGASWSSTAAYRSLAGATGVIKSWRIRLGAAPGAGKSRTFVIIKNGTAQDGSSGTPNTTITISESATTGSATFWLPVTAGDEVYAQSSASGTPPTTSAVGSHTFEAATKGQISVSSSFEDAPTASGTEYAAGVHPILTGGVWSATESVVDALAPDSLVLENFRLTLNAAAGGGVTAVYTLRKSGVDTAQTLTITAGNSSAGPSGAAGVTFGPTDVPSMKAAMTGGSTTLVPRMTFLGTVSVLPTESTTYYSDGLELLSGGSPSDIYYLDGFPLLGDTPPFTDQGLDLPTISGTQVYTPTFEYAPQNVSLPTLASGTTVYPPAGVGNEQAITGGTLTNSQTFYAPTVLLIHLEMPFLASGATVYAPAPSHQVNLPFRTSTVLTLTPVIYTAFFFVDLPSLTSVATAYPPSLIGNQQNVSLPAYTATHTYYTPAVDAPAAPGPFVTSGFDYWETGAP